MNSFMTNLTSSLTGNLPKAILCVRKVGTLGEDNSSEGLAATIKNANLLEGNLLGTGFDVKESFQLGEDIVKGVNGGRFDNPNGTSPSFSAVKDAVAAKGFYAIEVQYNPSSISMDTVAGKQVQPLGGNMASGAMQQMHQVDQPAATTMHMQLVFDDMNPVDAFTLNIAPTIGNAISFGTSLAREHSVQAQLDGILSLLLTAQTRQVAFAWSKAFFQGELCNVNGRYTMFNKKGNPVRAVVDLSIRQEGNEMTNKYWKEACDKNFPETSGGVVSGAASTLDKFTQNTFFNF